MTHDNRPTHLDLFSGIGGFSIAFEAAGFRTIGFSEIEPYPSAVLKRHWPDVPNFGDVTKLCRRAYDCNPEDENGDVECPRCGIDFGECECIGTDQFTDENAFPDVITGGFPCQPFSVAGEGRGDSDERFLWPELVRICGELRPRFALFENVSGLLSIDGGRTFNRVLSDLAALGYDCLWNCIPACAVGAPHGRDRVWIIAHTSGIGQQASNIISQLHQEPPQVWVPDDRALLPVSMWNQPMPTSTRSCGVGNGIPNGSHRIKSLGNAIVPQVAFIFAQAIYKQLRP